MRRINQGAASRGRQADKQAMARTSGGEPRYAQVAADLRAAIQAGDFGEGAQLPTESTLCERYGISRFTVREALRRLQAEGLIRRRRGSGTIVASPEQVLRQPLSDVAELLQYAADSQFHFDDCGAVTLSGPKAEELGVPGGSQWHHLTGVRRLSPTGPAIAVTEVYINPALAAHVPALKPGAKTLFEQLAAAAGFRVVQVVQNISAMAAGNHEAASLGIARRAPVLRIVRVYRDETGRIVEISVSSHPGERFTYSMHIDQ